MNNGSSANNGVLSNALLGKLKERKELVAVKKELQAKKSKKLFDRLNQEIVLDTYLISIEGRSGKTDNPSLNIRHIESIFKNFIKCDNSQGIWCSADDFAEFLFSELTVVLKRIETDPSFVRYFAGNSQGDFAVKYSKREHGDKGYLTVQFVAYKDPTRKPEIVLTYEYKEAREGKEGKARFETAVTLSSAVLVLKKVVEALARTLEFLAFLD